MEWYLIANLQKNEGQHMQNNEDMIGHSYKRLLLRFNSVNQLTKRNTNLEASPDNKSQICDSTIAQLDKDEMKWLVSYSINPPTE